MFRKKTLESDLERRLEIEKSGTPDVSGEVLRELEKPLDYEIETAQQFQARMAHVRSLMSELLVRTNLNEWAAHTEMAEQESEVVMKIRDACKAREMLREALLESQAKAEKAMAERKTRYEVKISQFLAAKPVQDCFRSYKDSRQNWKLAQLKHGLQSQKRTGGRFK
ncbi:unnamed protein product [Cylicostephanus goldi]|uniref:Uncharacterized protein n=1 Tax=Cylicostephanus goldi TaxID=71465 RepID=A0A3P6RWM2_CYLGO|nr:unnamed protein product [Cylicostephanus goldi]